MSELAYSEREPSQSLSGLDPDDDLALWQKRCKEGRDHRQQFEENWRLCNAFAADRTWTVWNRTTRSLTDIRKTDEEKGRVHHTANVITNYLRATFGKLYADDLQPDILFRRDDPQAVKIANQTNRAFAYGWEEEWMGDRTMFEVILGMITLGTEGMRVRFDRSKGRFLGEQPMRNGKVLAEDEARSYMAESMANGQRPTMRPTHEGQIVWEDLTPEMLVVPPGIRREWHFPWVIVEGAMPIETVKLTWPERAMSLQSENLIDTGNSWLDADANKLKDCTRVATGYEFPTTDHPNGRTAVWAQDKILERQDSLPWIVEGTPRAGIFYFHYQRLKDRFWSQGVVQPLIGPQRQRNRARSQMIEMKDRAGLGRVFAVKGTVTTRNKPLGKIMELVEVTPGHPMPQETTGPGPGPWLKDEVAMNDADMDRIAGIGNVSLGQPPAGVSAYASMALLKEEDDRRVGPVLRMIRGEVIEATKCTVEGMRRYWLPAKQVMIAGENHLADVFEYDATKIPLCYFVRYPKGAPRPRSEATEIQKIIDLWDRCTAAGQPLPRSWLFESYQSGAIQSIPQEEIDVQRGKAEQENQMIVHGLPVQPAPYDNDQLHIHEHRTMQAQLANYPEGEQIGARLQEHIQAHVLNAQIKQGQAQLGPGAPQAQGAQGQLGQTPIQNPLAEAPVQAGPTAAPGTQ